MPGLCVRGRSATCARMFVARCLREAVMILLLLFVPSPCGHMRKDMHPGSRKGTCARVFVFLKPDTGKSPRIHKIHTQTAHLSGPSIVDRCHATRTPRSAGSAGSQAPGPCGSNTGRAGSRGGTQDEIPEMSRSLGYLPWQAASLPRHRRCRVRCSQCSRQARTSLNPF